MASILGGDDVVLMAQPSSLPLCRKNGEAVPENVAQARITTATAGMISIHTAPLLNNSVNKHEQQQQHAQRQQSIQQQQEQQQ